MGRPNWQNVSPHSPLIFFTVENYILRICYRVDHLLGLAISLRFGNLQAMDAFSQSHVGLASAVLGCLLSHSHYTQNSGQGHPYYLRELALLRSALLLARVDGGSKPPGLAHCSG